MIGGTYFLPLTIFFLLVTIITFGYKAKYRHGYGPLFIGSFASVLIVTGKFYFNSNYLVYGGTIILLITAIWNAWPRESADEMPAKLSDVIQPKPTNGGK
ncbi:MAG TPA: hypothetical protein ENG79_03775 [Desulfobacteraceae bacterium]|nr:hypothetical protein [Desulfobacteraceae bacterium]